MLWLNKYVPPKGANKRIKLTHDEDEEKICVKGEEKSISEYINQMKTFLNENAFKKVTLTKEKYDIDEILYKI